MFFVFACMENKNLMMREAFPANAHPFERKNVKDQVVKNGNDVEPLKVFLEFLATEHCRRDLKFLFTYSCMHLLIEKFHHYCLKYM